MVENAVRLAAKGFSCEEIVRHTEMLMETELSFLMPADFDYLRRGGRLSPLVSYVGKTIRLVPVLTLSEDSRQLVMAGVKRNFKQAFAHVISAFDKHGVGEGWRVYVTHAAAPELAKQAADTVREKFPQAVVEVYPLTPAFITQGGPGCVAIQTIREE